MSQTASHNIALLEVTDVSGQKTARVNDIPSDVSVGEVIDQLLADLALTRTDSSGRPLTYHARLEREGRHLHASERVGDSLVDGDRLVLQPNIDAGGGCT
ncbi:MAG: hypothetical protein IPK33_22170 [Gemmatimonadetes bacterium]|nr:hypothetical protein [Gemmatimonadota bacterium]